MKTETATAKETVPATVNDELVRRWLAALIERGERAGSADRPAKGGDR